VVNAAESAGGDRLSIGGAAVLSLDVATSPGQGRRKRSQTLHFAITLTRGWKARGFGERARPP